MNGVFVVAWIAAAAGIAKWLAMAENSVHAFALPRPILQRIRGVHNVLLFGLPPLVFWGLGLNGPRLLWADDWSAVGLWGWTVLSVGWLGALVLVATTVRFQLSHPPAPEVERQSRIVDVAARHPGKLISPGRAKWLAKLPRNQQFTLEVNEKTYALARLPAAWDGVSIAHFSDSHFRGPVTRRFFEVVAHEAAALQADVIAFTGDLLDRKDCLPWFAETFGRLSAPLGCYFVLGNHDWYLGIEAEVRRVFADHSWIDIAGRVVTLERSDVPFAIAGTERPWMGVAPDLSAISPDVFKLLLSHTPDQIRWAQRHGVDVMLAGHTHGGQIRLPIIGPVYAPSLHDVRYASGEFWEPPTLLHVTRGLSGREPIRYNCRPELTKLILRTAVDTAPR
jgi:predicted MPP superfamily phosphohydrolase